ncbi:G2/mitotic-specific cyclin S13-7-like [Zingiber officinale]|uniref:G2/mitotic-specific cyclin S13-7-like n=1 Tax=Zingiber officinale TaxID=94328 RepID=UPI001C4CCCDE|nr:G2/mitotic-specific cyclin S13-7-like [Zingiber officinale]
MASRRQQAPVLHRQRVVGVVPPAAGKPKIVPAADAKNRRALGDIGNLVNPRVPEGKQQPQINRPITRSFGAQLLANAKAAAADANKIPVVVASDGAVDKRAVAKPPLNKVPSKPEEKNSKKDKVVAEVPSKPEEKNSKKDKVAAEVPSKPEQKNAKKEKIVAKTDPDKIVVTAIDVETHRASSSHKRSSGKKVNAYSSVLTARSKIACGISCKPKDLVDEIDVADAGDQLAVVDYVEDIYKFYKSNEHASRPHDYMNSQVEINAKMRAILADWLIEVNHRFQLTPETLYLTFNIVDRYLSTETALRKEFQLIGVSAMLISSKYEEIWAPEVNDFICIADRAYTREQILGMEKRILNKLEWNLTVPTLYVFLVRFIKAASCDKEMEHMVYFFAELALMNYSMIMFCPSMVAASAVYAAQCTLNKKPLWNERLKRHTGFSENQLLDCAEMLVNSHAGARESKLRAAYKKYSGEQFSGVALRSPATKMVEELKTARI